MITSFKANIEFGIDSTGVQIHEVKRTRAFSYSYFNLDAITRLAVISSQGGDDLWQFKSSNGTSIELALDFLVPYIDNPQAWPYPMKDFDTTQLAPVLLRAIRSGKKVKYQPPYDRLVALLNLKANNKFGPKYLQTAVELYLLNTTAAPAIAAQ